jgi:NAD(P)-dependent dehydrogenase (short-subunit alcohol dehydrogenase family)
MNESIAHRIQPDRAAQAAAALRGALAQSSGDADRPWRTVILESAHKDSAGIPPLMLAKVPDGEGFGDARAATLALMDQYRQERGASPELFALPDGSLMRIAAPVAADDGDPLHNRVAVVTGAAGAIGRGICRGLLASGARVAALDLSAENLKEMEGELGGAFPGRLLGVTADVTSPDSVAGAFARVARHWGGVDIVIVNAGIAHVAVLTELPLETFRKLEQVNVEGTLLCLAEAARLLKLQATGGDIVLISTKNVFAPGASFGAYSATKAASHQLARIASLELAQYDIRVNMVAPDAVFSEGPTKSGLWAAVGPDRMKARGLDEAGLEEHYRNRNLLKARVTARHVANAVLFFVTRQTPTTGATIPVDGGLPDSTPR